LHCAAAAAAEVAATPDAERILSAAPNAASYDKHLLLLTEEPHMAGTERTRARGIRSGSLPRYGLDEVSFHEFPALLSFGIRGARHTRTGRSDAEPARGPYPADKDSRLYDDPKQVAFHGYAPSGKVRARPCTRTAAARGLPAAGPLSADLKGKIVLMRYSNPYSYRGYKVYEAEKRGAAGTIIYSDPAESGAIQGPVYPHGPWGPESAIEWGVLYDWLGQVSRSRSIGRSNPTVTGRSPLRTQLPRIPLHAVERAQRRAILKHLQGPEAPADWQGALPLKYHIGPGPVTLEMDVQNEERVATLRSVIGAIRGRRNPKSS
jgi:N-acetylated-alpha-linked acidic dipeptidase